MIPKMKPKPIMSRPDRVIISGGGTGGHIFPAIAIADALRDIDPTIEVLFVGAEGRMEMQRVPAAGYPIKGLWISGFQRKITLQNLLFPVKLIYSLFQAKRIVHQFKPDIAVGVGGYASGPLLQVAVKSGIKAVIQEQNSLAGATNRILGSQVHRIYTAYPGMEKYFDVSKIKVFGNPIRESIKESKVSVKDARKHYGLDPDKKTILIFGGSLGAGILNKTMDEAYEFIRTNLEVQFIWQTGSFYVDQYSKSVTAALPNVCQLSFIDDMDKAYAAADLVICRAGALTISELSILGKATILVPSPHVAEDHQTHNARSLEQEGAAIHLPESSIGTLLDRALELVGDASSLQQLQNNIHNFARPNAAMDIARDILQIIHSKG